MGAIKQMLIEQMEKDGEEYTDEYGGFMDNDEPDFDEDQAIENQMIQRAEDALEDREIERQIKEQEKKNG
tara:strand:- start:2 stop:211 length:210 start_codon:yes stop_codon:yes gene_type:complete